MKTTKLSPGRGYNYPEKQRAVELICKKGWNLDTASSRLGFSSGSTLYQFLVSDRRCTGLDFMAALLREENQCSID